MTISDIHLTKRGRFAVYSQGEFVCTLSPEVFAESGLQIGMEIEPSRLSSLQYDSELQAAKQKALRLLGGQDYTRRQLYEKLLRFGGDESIAEAAVSRMEELGYLDDRDYALRAARDMVALRHFGARRIRQELIRRGIAQEYVEEALEQLESDPRERIAQLILRKYPDLYEGERQRARAFNGLMRLGYGFEDIRYVAGHLEEFIEQDE